MKAIDYFLRFVTVAIFVALIVAPDRWGGPLALFGLLAMGMWALLYPPGILGWARTAHPSIEPEDRSIWWISRFLGGAFIIMSVLITFAFRWA